VGTSTSIPLSEYLSTSYQPDREWVDGELRERNMGEGAHSIVQAFLIGLFRQYRQEWQVRVHPEQRVQTSFQHYRVPDLCLVRANEPLERVMTKPPMLCVEILSWNDRMTELDERVEDYLSMGVPVVWIIDPRRRKAFLADFNGRRSVSVLGVAGTLIQVPVQDIFAELDELESPAQS